jgi:hypothetical protein
VVDDRCDSREDHLGPHLTKHLQQAHRSEVRWEGELRQVLLYEVQYRLFPLVRSLTRLKKVQQYVEDLLLNFLRRHLQESVGVA